MAAIKNRLVSWASSHSLHERKLPFRLAARMNEGMVDFIHGNLIGIFAGLLIGLLVLKIV